MKIFNRKNKPELFISHAGKDSDLVNRFTEFLMTDFKIPRDNIYCTCAKNNEHPKVGQNYIEDIRNHIKYAKKVFFIITEAYLDSAFCVMEMGAAWAYKSNIIPIIVPPLTNEILKHTPLLDMQYIDLNNWVGLYNELENAGIIGELKLPDHDGINKHIKEILGKVNDHRLDKIKYNVYSFGFSKNAIKKYLVMKESIQSTCIKIDISNEEETEDNCFLSFVCEFYPYRNWSEDTVKDNLYFEICSPAGNIQEFTLELKCTSRNARIYTESFLIVQDWRPISISLEQIRKEHKDELQDVSEICFVLRPEKIPEKVGEMYIRGICFA